MLRRVDYFDDFFSVQVLENGGCHQNFQHIVYQVSVLQCAELAGCESELGFFFELFSSVYFSFFDVRGPRGGNLLQAEYRSIQFSKIVMRRYRACWKSFRFYGVRVLN